MDAFSIGDDDEEEDLIEVEEKKLQEKLSPPQTPTTTGDSSLPVNSPSGRSEAANADRPNPASLTASTSLSSNLTTFSNIGAAGRSTLGAISGATVAGASGGIVPPTKGLRGVLDNIVSDGMRMAAEVRKKMEEAQREMERNALGRAEEEDVRDRDRDLLEGAEATSVLDGKETHQPSQDARQHTPSPAPPSKLPDESVSRVEFDA